MRAWWTLTARPAASSLRAALALVPLCSGFVLPAFDRVQARCVVVWVNREPSHVRVDHLPRAHIVPAKPFTSLGRQISGTTPTARAGKTLWSNKVYADVILFLVCFGDHTTAMAPFVITEGLRSLQQRSYLCHRHNQRRNVSESLLIFLFLPTVRAVCSSVTLPQHRRVERIRDG